MEATNLNLKAKKQNHFDAIVIGAGMSGSWVAKEFCEKGLKTLVLERGRNIEHISGYETAMKEVWEFPYRNTLSPKIVKDNPVVSKCYAFREATQHHFVKDSEHPYVQTKPFDWIRGYQVGGKSLMWARHVQRWAKFDFEANSKDGHGVDWPIRYEDLAPWYSHVEKFAGISGNKDGLDAVPDGEFLPPMPFNDIEKHCISSIESSFPERNVIFARVANLSQPHNGRVCMYRSRCERGCPYGGYFSANSVTIPAAAATGNMTLRPFSVVQEIMYNNETRRASGVRVIDSNTKEVIEYTANVISINAGAINSLLLLMNSKSDRFPNGIGNDSGTLGHYLMFHNYRIRASGQIDDFKDSYFFGRKPTSLYIPRFRNVGDNTQKDFLRGYSFGMWSGRGLGSMDKNKSPIGADLKDQISELGGWSIGMTAMGEVLPRFENKISLSKTDTDEWGMPLVEIDIDYSENEESMCKDMMETGAEMLEAAGAKNVRVSDSKQAPGLDIHEMGGCRMGKDPSTSMLNKWNQMHAVSNVLVTDGACMSSTACQNPSITYMALSARAATHAVEELKKGNL
ncbi:MAG: GMC family oxidoreductase [Balneolaceae bacterium]|nr:GMC family oxidoreductase [Balneolaceae bacterium]MBO6545776.1 GMC family oxidoreductase [Balneolaceae bacterium]MBO6647172.1 GMC family oxidoreductase [Balneolaceae bacterium]